MLWQNLANDMSTNNFACRHELLKNVIRFAQRISSLLLTAVCGISDLLAIAAADEFLGLYKQSLHIWDVNEVVLHTTEE